MKLTITNALEQFLFDNELKGNSQNTINDYKNIVGYFINYIGKDTAVVDITLNDLKQYHMYLKTKKKLENHPYKPSEDKSLSSKTIQTYIRHLRAFLGWLYEEKYIKEDFRLSFKLPKSTRKAIEILSDEEITMIMKRYNERAELGLRNKCILCLMLDSGLRLNEVVSLDVDNVHFELGVIKVCGKGAKERIVPLGTYTKRLLHKYIYNYRPQPLNDSKCLFVTKEFRPITADAIKMVFLRLRKRTGITRLKPHLLRHTYATLYIVNGGDAFSLQLILGHSTLFMTRKYTHLASSYSLIEGQKKYSPMDNINKKMRC